METLVKIPERVYKNIREEGIAIHINNIEDKGFESLDYFFNFIILILTVNFA